MIYVPRAPGSEDRLAFCCTGCVAAWHILQGRDIPELAGYASDSEADARLAAYDMPEIAREYLQTVGGESRGLRLELDVHGIHCQSCVTVCERSLERLPEVERVAVDYDSGRARIDFVPYSHDRTSTEPGSHAIVDAATSPLISRAIRQLRLVGYDGTPLRPGGKTAALRAEGRGLLWKMALAGFATGNTMMLSIALWSGYFDGSLPAEYKRLFEWMQLLFTTPVYLYAAGVFHRGWRGLFRTGTVGMDVLISAGISAAFFYSVFVFLRPALAGPASEVYFDSVTMIVFLLLIGRYIEWRARLRQRERMESLLRPFPDYCYRLRNPEETAATVVSNPTTHLEMIAVSELRAGDRVLIRSGESVPADGVLYGPFACEVDEAVLTGEARPVLRVPGDRMLAGSSVLATRAQFDGVVIQIHQPARESSLGVLARMTDATGHRRSRIERHTAGLVPYFGVVVLAIALTSFFYFYAIAGAGLEAALLIAVSVLIVSCPCALALSVPTAAGAALFLGLRRGVLFRDGRVLEELDTIRNFCFDKTGTLTTGRPRVIAHSIPGETQAGLSRLCELIQKLEAGTTHPVGMALLDFAREHATGEFERSTTIEIIPGRGIRYAAQDVRIGSLDFLGMDSDTNIWREKLNVTDSGATLVGVAMAGRLLAMFALDDQPREDALDTLDFLRARDGRISVLTGDHRIPAEHLGRQLKIPTSEIHAGLRPEDKTAIIRAMPDDVCMVGDGFNDAPALAAARLSVVHALGAPLALEQAGIVLLNNRLSELKSAARIARAARVVMRANLGFSLLYNAIMIPLAAVGLLLPIWCALFMALSSLTVIGSSAIFRVVFRER